MLAGYCAAVARRVASLLQRIGIEKEFTITGGIAKNSGLVKRIEKELGIEAAQLGCDPALVGAIGAALFAQDFLLERTPSRR